jgi:hypothetical protein
MILLFDDIYCVVGSLLGECLVVVLVLVFGLVRVRSRGDVVTEKKRVQRKSLGHTILIIDIQIL